MGTDCLRGICLGTRWKYPPDACRGSPEVQTREARTHWGTSSPIFMHMPQVSFVACVGCQQGVAAGARFTVTSQHRCSKAQTQWQRAMIHRLGELE